MYSTFLGAADNDFEKTIKNETTMKEKKDKENHCEELKNLLSKSNSRTSMTSRTSDRVSPEGQGLPNFCPDKETSFGETENFVKLKNSLGTIFSDVTESESVPVNHPNKMAKMTQGVNTNKEEAPVTSLPTRTVV